MTVREKPRFQITISAMHPGHLASFWVKAIGYVEEADTPEYLARLREMGHDPADRPKWEAAIRDPDGVGPRIYFERALERPDQGRIHLDINVGRDRADAEADRLVRLGARRIERVRSDCIEMADPEGNHFCVQ